MIWGARRKIEQLGLLVHYRTIQRNTVVEQRRRLMEALEQVNRTAVHGTFRTRFDAMRDAMALVKMYRDYDVLQTQTDTTYPPIQEN